MSQITSFINTKNSETEFIQLPLAYTKERQRGVGLVAPFDFALDDECWQWMPAGVPLYVTRTEYTDDNTVNEDLAQQVSDARVLIPAIHSLAMAEPAAVAYACTMGSFINGNAGEYLLRQTMEAAGAHCPVTTSGAMVDALQSLGIKKVAIATPYTEDLTQRLVNFLMVAGIDVTKAGYLASDHDIMHIGYDIVEDMAHRINSADADALFFSCTNLRTFGIIEKLETALGKPVFSANQVTMWAALKEANLPLPQLKQRLFGHVTANS